MQIYHNLSQQHHSLILLADYHCSSIRPIQAPKPVCLNNDPAISLLCSHSLASENWSISIQFDANIKVIWKSFHFSIIANFTKQYKLSDLALFEWTALFKTFGEAGCGCVNVCACNLISDWLHVFL